MDYKEKYEQALAKAKDMLNYKEVRQEDMEYLFPELKESEDEKIRELLINLANQTWDGADCFKDFSKEKILSWLEKQGEPTDINPSEFDLRLNKLLKRFETLPKEELASSLSFYLNVVQNDGTYKNKEKQGEHKSIWHNEDEEPQRGSLILLVMQSGTPIVAKIIEPNHTFNHGERWAYIDDLLEKQGEQPRYSIGDVLCDKSCTTLNKDAQPNFEIVDIRNGMYICDKCSFPISQQDEYELVAKKIEQKPAEEYNGEDYGIDGLYHAQRILEKTLGKVNGYQSDDGILAHQCAITAVKKLYNQKPVRWSEEDEQHIDSLLKRLEGLCRNEFERTRFAINEDEDWLKSLKPQPKQEWSEEDKNKLNRIYMLLAEAADEHAFSTTCRLIGDNECVELQDFLKSLRPQNHWKPTEEQMIAIRIAAEVGTANDSWAMDILKKIYNQLKLELKGVHNNEKEEIRNDTSRTG